MDTKRMVLLSARMRFSPTGASLRDDAIERIIEQNLAFADKSGLTEDQLRDTIRLPGGRPILNAADVRAGLERLIGKGRVHRTPMHGSDRFALCNHAEVEVAQIVQHAKQVWDSVVQELFGAIEGPISQYADAFVEVLCHVFARISSGYVAILVGKDVQHTDTHHFIQRAIEYVLKSRPLPDRKAFEDNVSRFFRESTPEFDAIKWNMAQNFYVSVALGIDPQAHVLSSELLAGATIYLDTNVLIAGLIPTDRHHRGFHEIVTLCRDLGMRMVVAQITVDELRRVVAAHATMLRQVYNRIPPATRQKVHCFLLESYLQLQTNKPDLQLDDFLRQFQAPIDCLRDAFQLEIEDDPWFDTERSSAATEDLALKLSAKFSAMRNRPKNDEASRHDALLLRWVDERRRSAGANCRITTLDMTVVAAEREALRAEPRAISLDALLQWASPHCSSDAKVEQVAAIYSNALKYQLLPTEQFLDLRDFRVFAEMELETAQLPAEDVEACVRELRKVGPNLDPGKAEDREKIAKTIQKFFADPGRKFKQELSDLQAKNAELTSALRAETEARRATEASLNELRKNTEALSQKNNELDAILKNEQQARKVAEDQLSKLRLDLDRLTEDGRRRKLTKSILLRCLGLALVLVLGCIIVGSLAIRYSEGANNFQKLTNAWAWFGLPLGIVGLLFPFVMGRERMRYLKWWKAESN